LLPLTVSVDPAAAAAVPWLHDALARMRRHLVLKSLGLTVFMSIFFIGYFHLLRHPSHGVTVMPLTALDHWISFRPTALLAYVSLWIYVGIPPMLMRQRRELVEYMLWIGALCVTGLACFYLWPTAVPVQALDLGDHPGFAMLQGVDAAGNACPSLHVATASFTAVWVDRLLRELKAGRAARLLNWAWLVAIAYSTLAIKQHVVWDVAAGAALGLVFALAYRPRRLASAASTL